MKKALFPSVAHKNELAKWDRGGLWHHCVVIAQSQWNMFSWVAPVSCCWCPGMGSWEMVAVSFSFSCVTCSSLSVSPPRSALTMSGVLPELSNANMLRSGRLPYFGAGRKRSYCKVKSCFPPLMRTLGILCGTDPKLPGCDRYVCCCIMTYLL